MRNREEFPRSQLTELASTAFESWAKESYEIAAKITYQAGALRATPKASRLECSELADAAVLPPGYARIAGHIGNRRMMLASYRLADVLKRITGN